MIPSASGLDWADWSTPTFARAQAERRPVLLSIVTRWSEACRNMDRAAFSDPDVVGLAHAEWVPIRVDADRRPDLADRYTLGGWPTTAFLTETGELIGGGTWVEANRLRSAMREVGRVYRERRHELLAMPIGEDAGDGTAVGSADGPNLQDVAELGAWLQAALDPAVVGSRAPDEAPPPAALLLLVRLSATGDSEVATRSGVVGVLDAIADGPLWDPVSGGFYRESPRDGIVGPAKLLDVNAGLLAAYAEAAVVLGEARFGVVARRIARYLDDVLHDERGGAYHPSEYCASASRREARPGDGSGQGRDERARSGRDDGPHSPADEAPPRVETVFYVDGNARLASAYLRAGCWLGEPSLVEAAVGTIERVIPEAYERGAGVAHCLDPRPRVWGLLGDQVASCAALLDAAEATGRVAYADLAEELLRSALRKLWDDTRSALADRVRTRAGAGDVGRLGRPRYPFALNCEAAQIVARIGARAGDVDLQARARRLLAGLETESRVLGLHGAAWGVAALEAAQLAASASRTGARLASTPNDSTIC